MAKITFFPSYPLNKIDFGIFGHFVEQFPNNIPGGIFDPSNPLSDEDGFRRDVIDALRKVGVTQIRWAGNFSSSYHWFDGVGPKTDRPKKLNFAWDLIEDNQFGTVEFIKFCRKVGAEPVIGVNMGSGSAEEAMNWVEYCNGTTDSYYANLRRSHGFDEPFNVKYWCLGNEMYGEWQFCYQDAETYARSAEHFANAMKRVDPTIKLTAVGYETDFTWNLTTIRHLTAPKRPYAPGEYIDFISCHYYPIASGGAYRSSTYEERMSLGEFFSERTRQMRSAITLATDDSKSPISISWDEWNPMGEPDGTQFTLEMALWTGSILNSFIRDSQDVKLANYTFFVNVNGPIQVSEKGLTLHVEYFLFSMYRHLIGNKLIPVYCDSPGIDVSMPVDFRNPPTPQSAKRKNRHIPLLDTVATRCEDGSITLFVINKSKNKTLPLVIENAENSRIIRAEHHMIWNENRLIRNTNTECPLSPSSHNIDVVDGVVKIECKPHSINAFRLFF